MAAAIGLFRAVGCRQPAADSPVRDAGSQSRLVEKIRDASGIAGVLASPQAPEVLFRVQSEELSAGGLGGSRVLWNLNNNSTKPCLRRHPNGCQKAKRSSNSSSCLKPFTTASSRRSTTATHFT